MNIPKVIIQTSYFRFPEYYKNTILKYNIDWEYKYFSDDDIIEFIKKNPIKEFENALQILNDFENGSHKADFFRYYYLYLNGGVFLDYDTILKCSLSNLLKDISFFTCNSFIKNNSTFNGFIGCEPKNIIIYNSLKKLYFLEKKILNFDYYFNCKDLYYNVNNYINLINEIYSNNNEHIINTKYKIFEERKIIITNNNEKRIYYNENTFNEDISNNLINIKYSYIDIYDDSQNTILEHHLNSKITFMNDIFKEIIPDKTIKKISDTKIGITLDLPEEIGNIFCNGIRQNVFYLNELFLNIGYETYFIVNKSYNFEIIKQLSYDNRFKFVRHNDILEMNFDIVISMGYEIEKEILLCLKNMKTKLVSYNCGNSYIIDSETILYNQHKNRNNKINYIGMDEQVPYDIIWSIPQMSNTNKYYWTTLFRTKCIEAPFIWSDKAIDFAMKACKKNYNQLLYVKREIKKKIAIFEPNISIMKWCGPPILICENAYRKYPNIIKQVYINNINDKKNNTLLNEFNLEALTIFVNNLNICKDRKLSIEGRFNTLDFMSTFADIVVSHQWENNLNYLYFDLAWMGWPIVHNASLCSEIGYYYTEFNYEEGSEQLLNVLYNHDNNIDEYIIKNRKIINNYLPSNLELQSKYIDLINILYEN